MIVKLLTEHYLEFLSLKGGCRGSSKSILVKMPNRWKSHVTAQFFPFFSNTMSSQEQVQLTEEAVMMRGLSGVHSEVALLLWANRHDQLLHPLVETRLSEIRSTQMTSVDESIMYHVKSFTKEPETLNPTSPTPTKMNFTALSPRNSKDLRHSSPPKFVPSLR